MNIDILNKAVQFAIDEHVHHATTGPVEDLTWLQAHWAKGVVTDQMLTGKRYGSEESVKVVCASGCCLAGTIVHQNGDKFVLSTEVALLDAGAPVSVETCLTKSGRIVDIDDRARKLLGVDTDSTEEGDLFDGDNEIEDVIRIAEALAEEHGATLTIDRSALDNLDKPWALDD